MCYGFGREVVKVFIVCSRGGEKAVLKSPSEGKKRHHHLETQHAELGEQMRELLERKYIRL